MTPFPSPYLSLPIGDNAPEEVHAVIEIPRGSSNKYEYDTELGVFKLDRPLYSPLFYPFDYGWIAGTMSADGDPVDVLVIGSHPTFPGCAIRCRAIGMFVMRDEKGPDEKVLCVPAGDPRHEGLRDVGDVPAFDLLEITHFFEVYKDLEPGKSVEGSHWEGREKAYEEIAASRSRAGGPREA